MRDDIVFLDVDTQHDFMDEGGALAVPGASHIRANLRRLTRAAVSAAVRIFASQDAHPEGDPEFDEFGPHCVKGTPGAGRIDETQLDDRLVVPAAGEIPRGMESVLAAKQVVFQKETLDAFTNPALASVLGELPCARVVVYGVATEYCVAAACRGLRKLGRDTALVTDAVRGVTAEGHEKALSGLRDLGVRMATTDEVLAGLGPQES